MTASGSAFGQAIEPPSIEPAPRIVSDEEETPSRRRSALLTRVVRHFDFEEIIEQPFLLPIAFEEVRDRSGFPGFHTMRFSNAAAHGGAWSFEFVLQGGSVGASTDPFEISVIPGGDYRVTAWVKTAGLEHARARVVAVFHDQTGREIEASRVESEPIRTGGRWRQIALTMRGHFDEAAHLGLELQLLQPDQFRTEGFDPSRPMLEDVTGRVWWDDVIIHQLPRIELSTSSPDNIIEAPSTPRLHVRVSDLAGDALTTAITVTDDSGRVAESMSFPLRGGRLEREIDLPALPFGWYRATVTLREGTTPLIERSVTFLYLPSGATRPPVIDEWGVNLDGSSLDRIDDSAAIIQRLHIAPVVIPVWGRTTEEAHLPGALESALDRILDVDGDVVFAFSVVPDLLADELKVDRSDVVAAFQKDGGLLDRFLEPILVRFGQRVQFWQLGSSLSARIGEDKDDAIERARARIGRLVPGPIIVLPVSPEHVGGLPPSTTVSIVIPSELTPSWTGAAVERPLSDGRAAFISLDPLPAARFTGRDRVIDLVLRAMYARRAGAVRITLERPWEYASDQSTPASFDPTLGAWLELRCVLGSARFAGEVPVGPGLQCWAFEDSQRMILVAWNESASPDQAELRVQLAESDITVCDLFGNERSISLVGGVHRIVLSDEPVMITGADPRLVRFRQSFRIGPSFINSRASEHALEIDLINPWDIAISGTILLTAPRTWRFSPRRVRFSIPAGGEARLPLTLYLGRTELAGTKRIEAIVEFVAERTYSFHISTEAEIGLDTLEIATSWRVLRGQDGRFNDLLIQAHITNTADHPLDIESFIVAPGYSRMRRLTARLDPGDTTIKSFYLRDGLRNLAGTRVIVGVGELESSARLNHAIDIPPDAMATAGKNR